VAAALLALGVLFAQLSFVQGAAAACETDTVSNSHSLDGQGVPHGWTRTYNSCNSPPYHMTGWTNHGHGDKHASVWKVPSILKCDDVGSGSSNASCSVNVSSWQVYSGHKAPLGGATCSQFGDGHYTCLHDMEPIQ
jgi:hypothetical protein